MCSYVHSTGGHGQFFNLFIYCLYILCYFNYLILANKYFLMLCPPLDWQYAELPSSASDAVLCSVLVRKMWDI